jgi:hypothetical protein
MKKNIIILIFTILSQLIMAQCVSTDPSSPCCNELLNIDPHNNGVLLKNNERSDINFNQSNYLEWVNSNTPNFRYNKTPGNNPEVLTNSFVQYYSPHYPFFTNFGINGLTDPNTGASVPYSNMHPRYGWQLLHSSNNYQPFSTTPLTINDPGFSDGPYFLFYNKYTGQLRSMIYPQGYESSNELQFNLFFNRNTNYVANGNAYYTSAIFNSYDRMQSLDRKTIIQQATAIADNTQNGGGDKAYFGDFNLSYDPCVCVTLPEMTFEVYKRDKLKMYAEGRLVALSSTFDKSGNAPYKFGKDFMASVYGDYNTGTGFLGVKNGFLVYNKADQLAKDFFVSPEMQFLSSAIGLFGKAVNPISLSSGHSLSSTLGGISFLPSFMKNDTSIIKLPLGNALSAGLDFLSGQINPKIPNVMLMEGQIALRGEITNAVPWPGFKTKNFGHPGSPINKTVNKYNYPYYNEAPGLFAMLKTPEVSMYLQRNNLGLNTGLSIDLINGPIEYTLNPAAEIDMDKTKIYATFEFDFYSYPRNQRRSIDGLGSPRIWYEFYNDFWSLEEGTIAKVNQPIQITPNTKNNFYLNNTFSNGPISPYSNLIKSGGSVLFPSFFNIGNNLVFKDDVLQLLKTFRFENVNNNCALNISNSTNILTMFDKEPGYNLNGVHSDDRDQKKWNLLFKDILYKNTIQTRLVPIENLNKLRFVELYDHLNFISIVNSNNCNPEMISLLDPRLKIVAHYVFKENQYGEKNESTQIYTYRLKTNFGFVETIPSSNKPSSIDIMSDKTITSQTYSSSQVIYGKTIIINGNLSTINGAKVIIYANSITIMPGAIIDPNIQIIAIDFFNQDKISPQSSDEVKLFCSQVSDKYKAKEPFFKMAVEKKVNNNSQNSSLSLHPNPASSVAKLTLTNYQNSNVNIKIFDLMGREMLEVVEKDITSR